MYLYFSHGLSVQAATPSSTSDLSSSGSSSVSLLGMNNDAIGVDTAFLLKLTTLTKIRIDTSIFSDHAFQALNDNTVNLEPVAPGRPNPFAPIDTLVPVTASSLSPVVTSQATQVTSKTAILNGTINIAGVSSTYFEYGPTEALGKLTPPVKQSLIGTFVTNVTGLSPKTTYFFRAVAKAGTVPIYGDIASFNTN
jgi:hypothetical protein